jgi:hypothetical protein
MAETLPPLFPQQKRILLTPPLPSSTGKNKETCQRGDQAHRCRDRETTRERERKIEAIHDEVLERERSGVRCEHCLVLQPSKRTCM